MFLLIEEVRAGRITELELRNLKSQGIYQDLTILLDEDALFVWFSRNGIAANPALPLLPVTLLLAPAPRWSAIPPH